MNSIDVDMNSSGIRGTELIQIFSLFLSFLAKRSFARMMRLSNFTHNVSFIYHFELVIWRISCCANASSTRQSEIKIPRFKLAHLMHSHLYQTLWCHSIRISHDTVVPSPWPLALRNLNHFEMIEPHKKIKRQHKAKCGKLASIFKSLSW